MADSSQTREEETEGSRLMIEPDSVHEGEDGVYLDCPKCGSNASFEQIITTGHCSNHVDSELKDSVEASTGDSGACDADLALELVWET